MKTLSHPSWLAAFSLLASALAAPGAVLKGLWQLDGNLSNAVPGGLALAVTNWTPVYASVSLAGQPSTVLDIPAFAPSQTLSFGNPVGPNGAGTRTHVFSLAWDVNFRSLQTFESLLQTDPANADDVDVFNEGARIPPMTGLEAPIQANTWFRIVLTSSYDGANQHLKIYVNGTRLSGPEVFPTDGIYTLSPIANYIFTDNNGETGDAYLNSFAIWNGELTAAEVTALGAPTPTGIPEPAAFTCALSGAIALLTRRRARVRPSGIS
jgi:hypothetical protein